MKFATLYMQTTTTFVIFFMYFEEDAELQTIIGTVKAHNVFRDIKQTELTRCKVM